MRLQAKNIFLTYPQCYGTPTDLINFLRDKLASRNPLYICVSWEQHADGNPHLHAFISLEKKLDTTNARYFDSGDYHPNIQKSLHPKENLEYVKKEGNWEEWGECPQWLDDSGKPDPWDSVCTEAFSKVTRAEAEEVFASKANGRFTSNYNNVKARLNDHYRATEPPYEPPHGQDHFDLPQVLTDWYTANLLVCWTYFLKP